VPVSSVDVAGRRRSPATFSEFHLGRSPGSKGRRYPADPARVEEIVAVMRVAGEGVAGDRIRGLIVVLWRAGLRIQRRSTLRARPRSAPRRAPSAQRQGRPSPRGRDGRLGLGTPQRLGLEADRAAGRSAVLHHRWPDPRTAWPQTGARSQLRRLAAQAEVRRRFAPHQLRHARAVEMAREGVPLK
jgi:hypothetical protein